jgi:hypothetical protein
MMVPDGDVDVLAQHMIKAFPADAADRAAMRSNAFFVLGSREKSEKWLRVREQIKKIQGSRT